MDKALAAVAAVRNAIIDTVNACAIPSGGCLHVAALRDHLGPLPVRASDFTDALSSLVQTGVFRTRVNRASSTTSRPGLGGWIWLPGRGHGFGRLLCMSFG